MDPEPRTTKPTSPSLFALSRKAAARSKTDGYEAVTCLIMAALSVEAFLNDLAALADQTAVGENAGVMSLFASVSSHMEDARVQFLPKLEIAHFLLSGQPIDKGCQPYQDLALLFRLRNTLVHKRPEVLPGAPEERDPSELAPNKLILQLAQRGVLPKPAPEEAPYLLQHLVGPDVADWAIATVNSAVEHILGILPNSVLQQFAEITFHEMAGRERPRWKV